MLLELGEMLRLVAPREDAAMHRRVQRLHAPVEDLRKAREIAYGAYRDARLSEDAEGVARREHLDAQAFEAARQFDQSSLVVRSENSVGHEEFVVCSSSFVVGLNSSILPAVGAS